jgi:cytoskeletal protein CcmA (bactofilin family)
MEVQEHTEEVTEATEAQPEQPNDRASRRQRRFGEEGSSSITLGPRDTLTGKLTVEGDIRVQGTVEGELMAGGDVTVEERARVQASIEGRNVSVRGEVTGDTVAHQRLTLTGSGTLNGNVRVGRLAIEDGATLNGNVTMQKGDS